MSGRFCRAQKKRRVSVGAKNKSVRGCMSLRVFSHSHALSILLLEWPYLSLPWSWFLSHQHERCTHTHLMGEIYCKHHHRRNITSHHSLSLLWLTLDAECLARDQLNQVSYPRWDPFVNAFKDSKRIKTKNGTKPCLFISILLGSASLGLNVSWTIKQERGKESLSVEFDFKGSCWSFEYCETRFSWAVTLVPSAASSSWLAGQFSADINKIFLSQWQIPLWFNFFWQVGGGRGKVLN